MGSFSELIMVVINFFKNQLEGIIFFLGLDWLIESVYLHLFIALVFTIIISIVFNKLILVLIRKWITKLKFNIGKQLVNKKVFRPIGWAIPFLVFKISLGDISTDGGIIDRIISFLIIVVVTISLTRLLSALSETLRGSKAFSSTPIRNYFQLLRLVFYLFGKVECLFMEVC